MNCVEVGQVLLFTLTVSGLLVVFELYLTWCARRAAKKRKGRTER